MKRDCILDVSVGIERLGAAIRVLGTYTTNHKCETNDGDIVTPIQVEMTFDLLADYADLMSEQLERCWLNETGSSEAPIENKKIHAL